MPLPPDFAKQARAQPHLRGEDSLGWGIIGTSKVAARYTLTAIRNQPPLEVAGSRYAMTNGWVVGVFSHDEVRGRNFADTHRIPLVFLNLSDLVNHPEIACVYVCGHPRHHAAAALAALAAGKHVLCESPLSLTAEDALAVTHTALNRGLVLGVDFPCRGDPALQTLRNLLAESAIGDLIGARLINARFLRPGQQTWRLRENGGGVLLDRTIHDIDLVRFLLRDDIVAIQSISTQQVLGRSVEEDVVTQLTMRRSGLLIQLHDSFLVPHLPTSVELYGSMGTLVAMNSFEYDTPSALSLLRNGRDNAIRVAPVGPFEATIAEFHAAVRNHGMPLATGTDGLQALVTALAAKESIRRGNRIVLDETNRPFLDYSIS